MINKTQKAFLKSLQDEMIYLAKIPEKGEENYGEYIRELMIMEKSIEIDSIIKVVTNCKTYIGRVLSLWEGGFKILLRGRKEWKNGSNTISFAYDSIDEVINMC